MLFNKKISKSEKIDFLEYLSFQVKSDTSFEKSLERYIEGGERKKHIEDFCRNAITDIQNGLNPGDALLNNGFIENLEYGIVKNAESYKDLYYSLVSVININKNNLKNQNTLESSIRSALFTIVLLFLTIPFFKEDLTAMYESFGQMQNLTGKKENVTVEIPVLIKYWWSSLIVVGMIIGGYFSVKKILEYLYHKHSRIYYLVFKNRLYPDMISVFKTFYQIRGNMSVSKCYLTMSSCSPNDYWNELFLEIDSNIKNGGKASDILSAEKKIIPSEVVNCFIDAEDTGEMKIYLEKAIVYCENKNEELNKIIKEWTPAITNILLFVIVGAMLVGFVKDIMNKGLLEVMSSM